VVEASYVQYYSAVVQKRLSVLPYDRARCSYIVHSVPRDKVKGVVRQLRQHGGYLFVTDLSEHYYVSFASSWSDFIEAMQAE
jgi:hypothetical protein